MQLRVFVILGFRALGVQKAYESRTAPWVFAGQHDKKIIWTFWAQEAWLDASNKVLVYLAQEPENLWVTVKFCVEEPYTSLLLSDRLSLGIRKGP